jgi:hypothetical protein
VTAESVKHGLYAKKQKRKMASMRKVRLPITILTLTLAFAFPALLHAQSVLTIDSTQADFSAHTITISGINFGSTQPSVNPDAMQLAVTAFSHRLIAHYTQESI